MVIKFDFALHEMRARVLNTYEDRGSRAMLDWLLRLSNYWDSSLNGLIPQL